MIKQINFALLFIGLVFLTSCSSEVSEKEPLIVLDSLNALTDLESFNYIDAVYKYDRVVPVDPSNIYGTWKMIASYYTVDERIRRSANLEGMKFTFKENGEEFIDKTALGYGKQKGKWKLSSNKTRLYYSGDVSCNVRVKGDTMEWIQKSQSNYLYIVLVKQ